MKRSEVPRRLFTFFIVLFAGIGGVLYGYDIGVISGALLFMKKDISLSTTELSLIVAAVLVGGSIATFISGPLADYFGRKKMISIAAVFVIVGTIVLVGSYEFSTVLTGRLIQGIGIGIITIVIPLYLSETAPSQLRGRSVATFQLFLTGGILLAYVIDILFAHSGDWRGNVSMRPGSCRIIVHRILFSDRISLLALCQGKERPVVPGALENSNSECFPVRTSGNGQIENGSRRTQPYLPQKMETLLSSSSHHCTGCCLSQSIDRNQHLFTVQFPSSSKKLDLPPISFRCLDLSEWD